MNNTEICELCQREVPSTSRHHLIPRTLHNNKWFKRRYTREELHETVDLCRDCHGQIHKFISHKEMGRTYNSIDMLLSHEHVSNFIEWLRKR